MFSTCLNLSSPQSKFAQAILEKIEFVLKTDKEYVIRLIEHYGMFRADIDKQSEITSLLSKPITGRSGPCPCGSGKMSRKYCFK